jgi:hypothetical protein
LKGEIIVSEINRICPHCGQKLKYETYGKMPTTQVIAYCDNENCPVKPCTDSACPSMVYQEILAITGDKE